MRLSEKFRSKTDIRNSLQIDNPLGLKKNHSSRAYDRFFEGYTEEYVPKKNGKGKKLVRTYTGNYFVADQTERKWTATKIVYLLLFLAATVLFIAAATSVTSCLNLRTYYMLSLIPQPICVVFILWCMVALVNFLGAPEKMTIGEYHRGPQSLATGTKCYCFSLAFAVIGQLAQLTFCAPEDVSVILFNALWCLIAAMLMFVLCRMESRQIYRETPNPNAIHSKKKTD